MPSICTCASSTQKRQERFLEFSSCTFPSSVCLALGCNTTVSLLMTVHNSESFSTSSCGCGLISLVLGGVSSPKFLKLLFLVNLMNPGSTVSSWEEFWGIETWVIRPRPSLLTLLQESFVLWWCNQTQIWMQAYSQRKATEVQSSLPRRKKINPIMPSADVGNLQTKNECWRWLYPFWIRLAVPPRYPGCLPLLRKIQMWYFRVVTPLPPAAKDYNWIPNLQWGFILHPEF